MFLFSENFELLVKTPKTVEKFKNLILQLAIRGKLVLHDPNDEPAAELIKRAKKEKSNLLKVNNNKPLPKIDQKEKSFLIPENWNWVRLGEIIIFTNGYAFQSKLYTSQGVGLVRIGNIVNGSVSKENMVYIPPEEASKIDHNFQIKNGDLLIAMSGATTGKLGINNLDETLLLNQRVGRLNIILIDKFNSVPILVK